MDWKLKLFLLPEVLTICQLPPDSRIPDWASASSFLSFTRTAEELSLVCPQISVPEGVKKSEGWRGLKVEGPLDFSASGILASLITPLAREGISVFAVSTYDTDYLLVKEENLEKAVRVLSEEGNVIQF